MTGRVDQPEAGVVTIRLARTAASRSVALLGLTLLALLAACSTTPERKSGGYYLDDGPGAYPPANLDQVPDAVPRAEPIKASTARPYTVLGQTYSPMTQPGRYKARGVASWYGRRYHGQLTASGERYDMYAMTAAHTTLPIPSYARVTSMRNGKSVVVRINDRGPFRGDRLIDLSYVAAYKLGILGPGSDMVEVESLVSGQTTPTPTVDAVAPEPAQPKPSETSPPLTREGPGVYVQLGAFGQRVNAESFLTRMRAQLAWLADAIDLYPADGLFRVRAGPYASRDQAEQVARQVEQSLDLTPAVIAH